MYILFERPVLLHVHVYMCFIFKYGTLQERLSLLNSFASTCNESCLAMLVHAYICVNVHVHVCHFYLQARKNREIAHLQRKIDEVPSRAELTQYQQRFIELFGQGRLVDISLLNLSCFLHCFFLIFCH